MRAEEKAQRVKPLLYKDEDLSSHPHHLCKKKSDVVECSYNLKHWGSREKRIPEDQ